VRKGRNEMGLLAGRVAVVTGGNSGIGRAAALEMAREGAKVVLGARRVELGEQVAEEIRRGGGEAVFVPTDVSRAADVLALVETAVERYGRLDCAFNNAASYDGILTGLLAEVEEDEFERTIAVNLKGVWLAMKHEIRQMLEQDPPGGAIVNTSSVNGLGGVPRGALYAATKAGVLGLTKSAALEYGRQGIRVNALVAGAFRAPMLEHAMDTLSGGDPEARQNIEAKYGEISPLGRIGDPAEAARTVVWLLSDASSYVTGHSLIVDGGYSAGFR
jgi:NAD(P)-dependent dehydrogenase (short-subunit alcohol dehydrogenase family)